MILNALYELYERLCADSRVCIPRKQGLMLVPVSYKIVIENNGRLVKDNPIRLVGDINEKGEINPVDMVVFGHPKTNSVEPCFLCEKLGNMLGYGSNQANKYYRIIPTLYSGFNDEISTSSYKAICRFFETWNPDRASEILEKSKLRPKKGDLDRWAVFQIQGAEHFVHEEDVYDKWWSVGGETKWYGNRNNQKEMGFCAVTGKWSEIADTHAPRFSGISTKLAAVVSYNHSAFESYGKKQSANASVSKEAAFAYCNALNYILSTGKNSLRIGKSQQETTLVFWTDASRLNADEDEALLLYLMNNKANDAGLDVRIQQRLNDIIHGKHADKEITNHNNTSYYILGLAPAEGRISVNMYLKDSIYSLDNAVSKYYFEMELASTDSKENNIISFNDVLNATLPNKSFIQRFGKSDEHSSEIPPSYHSLLLKAVLCGGKYPDCLASAMIRQLRLSAASMSNRSKINGCHFVKVCERLDFVRCCYLKAWLTRKSPLLKLTPMLDTNNTQTGYVLGRLFAALVKTQIEAHKPIKLNRTIRESYYASASAMPCAIFPVLMKLYEHNLNKIPSDIIHARMDREVRQICSLIRGNVPRRLNMEQQALFALGFHHQTEAFFQPNDKNNKQ